MTEKLEITKDDADILLTAIHRGMGARLLTEVGGENAAVLIERLEELRRSKPTNRPTSAEAQGE